MSVRCCSPTLRLAVPSTRRSQPELAHSARSEEARFDLVLDLGEVPALTMHQPPQGYVHVPPGAPLTQAVLQLRAMGKTVVIVGPDTDGDGVPDVNDNCDDHPNANQSDIDRDGNITLAELNRYIDSNFR